jgi:hypothetical protein
MAITFWQHLFLSSSQAEHKDWFLFNSLNMAVDLFDDIVMVIEGVSMNKSKEIALL